MRTNIKLAFIVVLTMVSCDELYTEKDNGKVVLLQDNESFQIELRAQEGFIWNLNSITDNIIVEKDFDMIKKGPSEDYTFYFKTKTPGEGEIKLEYRNNQTKKVIKNYNLQIIVQVFD